MVIDVTDNGVGLAADVLATVFDLYAQVPGSEGMSQGGLGVGLSLAQRLVQSWQGFTAAVAQPQRPWLRVEHHAGPAAVQAAYQQVLGGKGDPRLGHMLSL